MNDIMTVKIGDVKMTVEIGVIGLARPANPSGG
jgi:hypothetical protein